MKVRVELDTGEVWEGTLEKKPRLAELAEAPPELVIKTVRPRLPDSITRPKVTYEDVDGGERMQRPKWMRAENPMQQEFLSATHSRYFKPKVKQAVKGISGAMTAGSVLGESVYEVCMDNWQGVPQDSVRDALGKKVMPSSWWDWRIGHARRHRWGQGTLLDALLNIDKLMQHCRVMNAKLDNKQETGYNTTEDELPVWAKQLEAMSGETAEE